MQVGIIIARHPCHTHTHTHQFVVDNRKGQKYLLIGFEKLVGEVYTSLLPKTALILKAFYDNDILEEEAILEWADKVSLHTLVLFTSRSTMSPKILSTCTYIRY